MTVDNIQSRNRFLDDRFIAFVTGLAALIVYLSTLCPTIFADDCGEIATAVATGGVMHPPGYPLYCLLGGLFVKLIPWGEPAHRLGLLSSVSAAASVSVLYLLCRRIGSNRLWAVASSCAFAFSYTLWQQATKVETYALNAFFVATLLYLSAIYRDSGKLTDFFRVALVGGLALTNHLTIVWLIPAVLLLTIPTLFAAEQRGDAWKALGAAAVICLSVLSLYAYELLAARTHPGGQIWGDTSNLHRLWLHITGARYHSLFHIPTLAQFYHREILFAPSWLWHNLGPMLIASAFGLFALWRRKATTALAKGLLAGVAGYLVCNSVYQILNIFEYYTSAVMILAALASVGATVASEIIAFRTKDVSTRTLALGSGLTAMTVCVAPIMINWAACDRSGADYYKVLAENTLATVPQGAVIVADGDNHIFPLWYVQEVLGERRDVTIIPRNEITNWQTASARELTAWCAARIQREHPETQMMAHLMRTASDASYAERDGALWDIVNDSRKAGRAVYFTAPAKGDMFPGTDHAQFVQAPGATLVEEGLLQRVTDVNRIPYVRDSLATERALEPSIKYEYAPPVLFDHEPDGAISNQIYAIHLTTVAQLLLSVKDYSSALEYISRAVTLDPKSARSQDTYAVICMMNGRPSDAIDAWNVAISIDPTNQSYRNNLATATQQLASTPRQRG